MRARARAVAAATGLAAKWAGDAAQPMAEVVLTTWTIVRSGALPPDAAHPRNRAFSRMTVAAAEGDFDRFLRAFRKGITETAQREYRLLVMGACMLGACRWPKQLVDALGPHLTISHRGASALVAELLELEPKWAAQLVLSFGDPRTSMSATSVLMDGLIQAADMGVRWSEGEKLLASLADPDPSVETAVREGRIRLLARRDVHGAMHELLRASEPWGLADLHDATLSVLARLARVDPSRAVQVAASTCDQSEDRVVALRALARGGQLPAGAAPLLRETLQGTTREWGSLWVDLMWVPARLGEAQMLRDALYGPSATEQDVAAVLTLPGACFELRKERRDSDAATVLDVLQESLSMSKEPEALKQTHGQQLDFYALRELDEPCRLGVTSPAI